MTPTPDAQGLLTDAEIDDFITCNAIPPRFGTWKFRRVLGEQAKLANSRANESAGQQHGRGLTDLPSQEGRSASVAAPAPLIAPVYDGRTICTATAMGNDAVQIFSAAPAHEGEPKEPRIEKSDDNACIGCPNTEYVWHKDFLAWQTYARALAAEVGRLKCYEKAWNEWRSLQTGDATKMMDAAIRCDAAEAALSAKDAEVGRLKAAVRTVLNGLEMGYVKSQPLMPEFDENATSIDLVSLESILLAALSDAGKK